MGNPSPRYTAEFKQRAVELYLAAGPEATYAEIARELGCDPGSLANPPPLCMCLRNPNGLLRIAETFAPALKNRFLPLPAIAIFCLGFERKERHDKHEQIRIGRRAGPFGNRRRQGLGDNAQGGC